MHLKVNFFQDFSVTLSIYFVLLWPAMMLGSGISIVCACVCVFEAVLAFICSENRFYELEILLRLSSYCFAWRHLLQVFQ